MRRKLAERGQHIRPDEIRILKGAYGSEREHVAHRVRKHEAGAGCEERPAPPRLPVPHPPTRPLGYTRHSAAEDSVSSNVPQRRWGMLECGPAFTGAPFRRGACAVSY